MDRDTRALTGIRGVAALWVVAHHLFYDVGSTGLRHFFEKGYLAVDLFFVLSGFVIALNNGAAFVEGARADRCLAFYRRRVERVYPLLAVVILLLLAVDLVSGTSLPSLGTLLANLSMTQAWFSLDSLVGPSWSISTEAFAYLAFPVIASCVFRRSEAALVGLVAASWCGLWSMDAAGVAYGYKIDPGGPLDIYVGPFPVFRCLCDFIAGVGAYRLACSPRVGAVLSTRGLAEGLLAAVFALTWLTDFDLAVAILFVPLVCALSVPEHAVSRALRAKVSMRLGELSYAIYLGHAVVAVPVMSALAGCAPKALVMLAASTASLAAAVVLHDFVEKPFRSLLKDRRSGTIPMIGPPPKTPVFRDANKDGPTFEAPARRGGYLAIEPDLPSTA